MSADERATLQTLLQFQRESLIRKVTGVDEAAARRSPVPSGTTLLWLVKHLTRAELQWFGHRFAGQDGPLPDETVDPADTVASVVAAYRDAWMQVDPIITGAGLDDLGQGLAVNLRWVLAHMLEETSRHAGHADILRELIDGETGR